MTLPATQRKAGPCVGTGSVSVYSFGFKTLSEAHLRVVQAVHIERLRKRIEALEGGSPT